MNDYFAANQLLWNELTEINSKSRMYSLEEFIRGGISLDRIVREELGAVEGKSLLHLQCHFGMDTLSWARLGADVTGVDFSPKAISLAKEISRKIGIDARFICSNIYDLPDKLQDQFDVVFTSYGVLCWLNDLKKWGELISSYLKPGGVFYIAEFHPVMYMFKNDSSTKELEIAYSYFHNDKPIKFDPDTAYADKTKTTHHFSYEWSHSISDIVNSLIGSGMEIQYIHEFPYCSFDYFPFMKKCGDGWWKIDGDIEIPMMFSLKAIKK